MNNSFSFYKNTECKYYPCHKNIDEINCLFCYCPLYFIEKCGGNYTITKKGHKDCSNCIQPHIPGKGYEYIQKKLSEYSFNKYKIKID